MTCYPKGTVTTPDDPMGNVIMIWVRDHRTYQGDDCLIYPYSKGRSGYGSYERAGKVIYVHRYMCEFRNGPSPSEAHHAAHTCGNGGLACVNPRHVEWKTNSENQLDRRRHGTTKNRRRLLTGEQAAEIRSMKGIEFGRITAERFGVTETTVRQIQSGKIWRDLSAALIPRDVVLAIRADIGKRNSEQLAKKFGLSGAQVRRIKTGESYRWVAAASPPPSAERR